MTPTRPPHRLAFALLAVGGLAFIAGGMLHPGDSGTGTKTEQLHEIRLSLPRNFFRLLPRLRDEPLAGLPRIFSVAWAWVAHTDSAFDTELLKAYLRAYQDERELSPTAARSCSTCWSPIRTSGLDACWFCSEVYSDFSRLSPIRVGMSESPCLERVCLHCRHRWAKVARNRQ